MSIIPKHNASSLKQTSHFKKKKISIWKPIPFFSPRVLTEWFPIKLFHLAACYKILVNTFFFSTNGVMWGESSQPTPPFLIPNTDQFPSLNPPTYCIRVDNSNPPPPVFSPLYSSFSMLRNVGNFSHESFTLFNSSLSQLCLLMLSIYITNLSPKMMVCWLQIWRILFNYFCPWVMPLTKFPQIALWRFS